MRMSHREAFDTLRGAGVGVNVHYIPVYRQPYYEKLGLRRPDYPEAERYYAEAISLPLFPGLSEPLQDRVVTALREACRS
jgi:dTDP-4-amino-4,6-dideoxygalactose transaminase